MGHIVIESQPTSGVPDQWLSNQNVILVLISLILSYKSYLLFPLYKTTFELFSNLFLHLFKNTSDNSKLIIFEGLQISLFATLYLLQRYLFLQKHHSHNLEVHS